MSIQLGDVNSYLTSITNASGASAKQTAIASYYQYLADNGVTYGTVAKNVALDTGAYGEFANEVLSAAGADQGKIEAVRLGLALADIDARQHTWDTGRSADGIISMGQVATYHYSVLGDNSLPKEAWGGSLFNEFVGAGSWLPIALSGDFSGITPAQIAALAHAINTDGVSANGVHASAAYENSTSALVNLSLLDPVSAWHVSWDASSFYLDLNSVRQLDVSNSYISSLSGFFGIADKAGPASDISGDLTLNAHETLSMVNGVYTLTDTTQTIAASRVTLLANEINSALPGDSNPLFNLDSSDVCTVTDSVGSKTYHIMYDPSSDTVLGVIGGTSGNNLVGNSSTNVIYTAPYGDIYGHYATANNDTLTGNGGTDYLFGDAGNDTYIWHKGDGDDTIYETVHATGTTSDLNILRLSGVTSSELYLNSSGTYNGSLTAQVYSGGTSQGSVVISEIWRDASSTFYTTSAGASLEIRYIQLDDVTYDTTKGMLYRGTTLSGQEYIYTSQLDTANDTVLSGEGQDIITSYGGDDSIDAGNGDDVVYAGAGNDTLLGGAGTDVLSGDNGNNVLNGGTGTDYLYAGTGNDTYIVVPGEGDTVIHDFAGSNTLDLQGAAKTFTNSGDDRTYTLTATGETIFVDDYNLHSANWTII